MLDELFEELKAATPCQPWFRGHGDASWALLPGLSRIRLRDGSYGEINLSFAFDTRAGSLLEPDNSGWTQLFAMQHHGLPTRLLDWTETPAMALHFALRDGKGDACIWVLDPYSLNEESTGEDFLTTPDRLPVTYEEFLDGQAFPFDVAAVQPLRHNPRLFSQRAGFTLHSDLKTPLDVLHPACVRKVCIPAASRKPLREFLDSVGVTEFSLFPDLDGLGRELRASHVVGRRRVPSSK